MAARMFIWPRYALEVDGKRVRLPSIAGAAVARLFIVQGHFVPTQLLIDAVYYDDPEGGPLTANNCIRVMLHRMRKLLAKVDVQLDGCQGTGFRLRLPHP
ncbi:MAG: hypothetical protein ACR2RF_05970 [Geminicoccaceae bacterium]